MSVTREPSVSTFRTRSASSFCSVFFRVPPEVLGQVLRAVDVLNRVLRAVDNALGHILRAFENALGHVLHAVEALAHTQQPSGQSGSGVKSMCMLCHLPSSCRRDPDGHAIA